MAESTSRIVLQGTKDNSTRTIPYTPKEHNLGTKKVFVFSDRGDDKGEVLNASEVTQKHGSKVVSKHRNEFTTHCSPLLHDVVSNVGRTVNVERVIPDDAKKASLVVYLDYLQDDISLSERNSGGTVVKNTDGTIKYKVDSNGKKVTASGYKVRYITEEIPTGVDATKIPSKTGKLTKTVLDPDNKTVTNKNTETTTTTTTVTDATTNVETKTTTVAVKDTDKNTTVTTVTTVATDPATKIVTTTVTDPVTSIKTETTEDPSTGANTVVKTIKTISATGTVTATKVYTIVTDPVTGTATWTRKVGTTTKETIVIEKNATAGTVTKTVTDVDTNTTTVTLTTTVTDPTTKVVTATIVVTKTVTDSATGKKTVTETTTTEVTNPTANTKSTTSKDIVGVLTETVVTTTNSGTIVTDATVTTVTPTKVVNSIMLPILSFAAAYAGKHYNDLGFILSNLKRSSVPSILKDLKSFGYKLQLVNKTTTKNSFDIMPDLDDVSDRTVSLRPNTVDYMNNIKYNLGKVINETYFNEEFPNKSKRYRTFNVPYVYENNIKTVIKLFMDKELPLITSKNETFTDGISTNKELWYRTAYKLDTDFVMADLVNDENLYLFDVLNFTVTDNVPYQSVVFDETVPTGTVLSLHRFTSKRPLYLKGGSNGTLTNDVFDDLVAKKLGKYNSSTSVENDIDVNDFMFLIDTGFKATTKDLMLDVMANRKNSFIVIGLNVDGVDYDNADDEYNGKVAIYNTLKAKIDLILESDLFKTKSFRYAIFYDTLKTQDYDKVSVTVDIGSKLARYVNNSWTAEYAFETLPNSRIDDEKYFVSSHSLTVGRQNALNKDRINYLSKSVTYGTYFKQLLTGYSDSTSLLKDLSAGMVVACIEDILNTELKLFNNLKGKSEVEFNNDVDNHLTNKLAGLVDGDKYTFLVRTYSTERDKLAGYKYRVDVKLFGDMSRTEALTSIIADRTAITTEEA